MILGKSNRNNLVLNSGYKIHVFRYSGLTQFVNPDYISCNVEIDLSPGTANL